jgi:hypothetical protein
MLFLCDFGTRVALARGMTRSNTKENKMTLTIDKTNRGWAIFSGRSQLSRNFRSFDAAQSELAKNNSFYEFWANSCGVSVDNTEPVIVYAE